MAKAETEQRAVVEKDIIKVMTSKTLRNKIIKKTLFFINVIIID